MAIRTGCGYGQTTLQQTLAVNTLGVVINNLALSTGVPKSRLFAFPMTSSAKLGNIGREGNGRRIVFTQDMVRAVTLLAVRSVRVFCRQ